MRGERLFEIVRDSVRFCWHSRPEMALPNRMQGRVFGPDELAEIRALLQAHPDWSRYQLSRKLARQWSWHSSSGQLKDMAARTLLNKLSERGWIELPAISMPDEALRPVLVAAWRRSPPDPRFVLAERILGKTVSARPTDQRFQKLSPPVPGPFKTPRGA